MLSCNKRQLVTTVLKDVKTEITVTTNNNNMEMCNVPEEILDIFTLGIPKYEDNKRYRLKTIMPFIAGINLYSRGRQLLN